MTQCVGSMWFDSSNKEVKCLKIEKCPTVYVFSMVVGWALLVASLATSADTQQSVRASRSCVTRVLVLGNSYTYFNDLPAIVSELAKAGHQCTVETRMVAPGGKTLKDHWENAASHQALDSQAWDFVVLQDQSTLGVNLYFEGQARVGDDEIFRPYAELWANEIRKHHATPVFYLTWARKATPVDQATLNYAYIRAAKATHSLVAPVGLAWARVRQIDPSIDLYYRDGAHPSGAGSYLAACAIYAAIFGKSPVNLPSRISGAPVDLETEQLEADKTVVLVDLPTAVATRLQVAAWDAWRELKQHGGYLNVNPVPLPSVKLPAGEHLGPSDLEGTWRGQILFYPGAGSTEMVLQLRWDGQAWKGHLSINYSTKDFPSESLELTDLVVGEREFTFSDPSSTGVNKFKILFRGVKSGAELRGMAETKVEGKVEGRDYRLDVLGDWVLHREK
jgi:hypothetical protein